MYYAPNLSTESLEQNSRKNLSYFFESTKLLFSFPLKTHEELRIHVETFLNNILSSCLLIL